MATTPRRKEIAPLKKTPEAAGVCKSVRYSRRLAEEICERIANGESWISMCSTDGMPPYHMLYAWRDRYPEFKSALARARDVAADYRAEQALQVAEATTAATVQADRLLVGTLMKHAALGAPHRWGAKAEAREPPGENLTVYVRHFERVQGSDGEVFVREIRREGEA